MSKIRCEHCQLSYDKSVLIQEIIDEKLHFFCCKGCQGIYHVLQENGLDSFYDKLGGTNITPPKDRVADLEAIGSFQKRFVKINEDGFSQISLIIEGIHCSACVWLNEKILHQTEGIIEASINGATHKAKIVWDSELIGLSQIITAIRSIGYNAYPYDPKMQEEQANASRAEYYSRLLVGLFATMNIMWIAVAQYAGYFSGMRSDIKHILNFAEFVLCTPALFYTGFVYYRGAYYALKHRQVSMDSLIATGASLAYIFSIYAMFSGNGETYFDSVTMIVTFVFAGKYLEVLTKKKAVDTLDSMTNSLPSEVMVVRDGDKIVIGVDEVVLGDTIELRPGEKVVIDGELVFGEGSFDESSISGESRPALKSAGEKIISGTICLDSFLRYKATSTHQESFFSKIVSLLEESMSKKPQIEQFANSISGYFSVVILSIALLTFFGWLYVSGSYEMGIVVAISVIVIACPCALGLATPVATLRGIGEGAKQKIIFKEASFLENMAKAKVLLLDKTGTITKGKPVVKEAWVSPACKPEVLYALLKSSTHPISVAISSYMGAQKDVELSHVKVVEAKGVSALHGDKVVLGGSEKLMSENGIEVNQSGYMNYYFAYNGQMLAHFSLEDEVKDDAFEVINELKKYLHVVMVTGDNETVAKDVAKKVGIEDVRASLLPSDKAQIVEEFQKQGSRVVMVGDGINDAVALSLSDIAISMGSGADVALNASDVVLLDDSLKSLKEAFLISRQTRRVILQNISFSLLYNATTIPVAVMGYIIPLIAALSMSLSSLVVIANSMRIKGNKK